MADVETLLGEVLHGWIQRQRLNPAKLAELSGLTRRTVYNVLGTSGRPEIETLWKLASGLAKDPHTGESDLLVYAEAFPDLLEAAGYPKEIAGIIRIDVQDEMTRHLRDGRKAEALLDFVKNYHRKQADEREYFERAIGFKLEDLE